jgi:enamine deaminase RidA (YjgF/YER057c/UK114 family)
LSEVANGASDVFSHVLGDAGKHTRTTVGVYQLPKNSAIEVDMIAALRPSVL